MIVCIAEKPSVAKEIAKILKANSSKNGYYEGNGYQVTWTFGHFCTLLPPNEYKPHWKSWSLDTLPMLPEKFDTKIMDDQGVQNQFRVVKDLFSKADEVINCGDAGQEGELIQRWVIKHSGYQGVVKRLWISSLTSEAIEDGFKNLKAAEDYDKLYYAASSRAIGDWVLGMNATRLYTLKYGRENQVLSIGRVQTPTLAMVVTRFLEIENFVAKPFWELQTIYKGTAFAYEGGKFNDKTKGEAVLAKVLGQPFQIVDIEQKEGKELPPRLFDLTSLQVHCNKKFGFSAEQTLQLTQKLYEKKVVTYPRVDTTFLPTDMYPKVEGTLKGMRSFENLVAPLIGKPIRKSSKVFNDKKISDHHAIVPTGQESPLLENEQKVYDAVARHYIAAFYPDCLVSNTVARGASAEEKFKASGKEILNPGWRVVFEKLKTTGKEDKKEEKILPNFEKGESDEHLPELVQKETSPPKQYTEATLLRAMETAGKQVDDDELRDLMKANGIGRPSTRANIIETLFKRDYIKRQKKNILPTPTGVQLVKTIQNDLLKSAELTGQWEKQLKDIEAGEFSAKQFIVNMKWMVNQLVDEVRSSTFNPFLELENKQKEAKKKPKKETPKAICPKCGKGNVLKGKSNFGCSQFRAGCDWRVPFVYMDKKLTDKQWERLWTKKSTTNLKGFKVNGDSTEGKIVLGEEGVLVFEPKTKPVAKVAKDSCPTCTTGTILKGKTAIGCSRWKEGCGFKKSFEELGVSADAQLSDILNRL